MWHDLLVAIALVLVIEGVLPFVSPNAMRRLWAELSQAENRVIRIGGLLSMMGGVILLQVLR